MLATPAEVFEAVFRGSARAAYENLDVIERAQVDHIIRLIELNPYIDGVHKIQAVVAPLVLSAYDNGTWRILYRHYEVFVETFSIRHI